MKVVLLAGGKGTRITEESLYRPKPMVEIGGMPILWHIMKQYGHFGFNEFVICAGYKQEYIKEWFGNYFLHRSDITFDYTDGEHLTVDKSDVEKWKVSICDTGLETMTGGRVRRIRKYVGDEPFLLTYGDAVCDVDIADTVKFHARHGKAATITTVIQKQAKGVIDIGDFGAVRSFREKQTIDGTPINAGYMVLEPQIFQYLRADSDIFEIAVLERLAEEGELMSYTHNGFWQCMDSLREKELLEKLWKKGQAPWAFWEKEKNG